MKKKFNSDSLYVFNERRNSSCLLYSHLNNHVMIDEIFILKKKCKQKI
jgi:hypothetical protein